MPNGEDSDGEPFRRLGPEAPGTAPRARHLLHCFIQSIILLLLSIAATPAAAQVILFPRGPSYTVPFTQGDIGDYKLAVAHNGDVVEPSEVLLSVRPVQGSGFVVTPRSGVTTAEFVSVFPLATTLRNSINRLTAVVRKSDDVAQDSFLLYFTFDASAQFEASSSARHTQLWTKAVNVYEGDAAPAALGFSWTVVGAGGKTWGLGATPFRIRCEVEGAAQGDLSDPAPDNSALFEFGRSPSASNSGEGSVRFRSAPDFENPPAAIGAGNVYHVRVYNRHDLRNIGGEGNPTGCTGTALDLVVTVQDVGAPAQVVGVSATQGGNALDLSWDAPATDVNGAAFAQLAAAMQVTVYDYRYRTVGAASWTEGTTTDTSVEITVPEASYELQVRAVSAEGSGAWSDVVGVGQQAGPPLNLATAAADGHVTLTWEVPSTTGGFDIQRYEYRVDGAGDWISTGMERRAVVTGLTNGQEYRFEVRAVTAAGSGPSVTMTATPEAVVHPPSAPRNLRATPGEGHVTLHWEAPSSDGGSAVGDYEYRVDGAGGWRSAGADLTEVVADLTNGREYRFEVRAVNAAGEGPPATVSATPGAAVWPPSAPRNLRASPGDGRVTLHWERPSSDGGSTITDYEYRVDGAGGWWSAGADLTEAVADLTNGREYRFEVRAVNGVVEGLAAAVSATPQAAIDPPSAPRNLRATPGNGRVTLSWEAPSSDGGAPITDYAYRVDGTGAWRSAGLDLREEVGDLTNGREHSFEVRAVNAAGNSPAASVTATPMAPVVLSPPSSSPSAPRNLRATPGDGRVTLSWEAPSSDGGAPITDYAYRVDGTGAWRSAGLDLREEVGDLTNGREHGLEVRAVNAAGDGPAASVTATPMAPVVLPPPPSSPSAPRNLRATPGDGRVTLRWERPSSDGGAAITHYEYQVDGAGSWKSAGADLREAVTGLTNGQEYRFEVRAVNSVGDGPPATATARPRRPPSAPLNLRASPGDGRVTFSWEPPSNFGGSTITDYECRIVDGSWISTGGDLTEEMTGLTNGRQYRFEVRAVNAAGAGPVAGISVRLNAAPSFPQAEYAFELPENLDGSRQGVELGRVTAEDPDGDALEHALVSGDTALFAVHDQDGALTYIGPGENFEAEPREYILTVGARDPEGAEAHSRVVVTVTAVNEPPTARDDEARTEEDKRVVIDVLDNDTDPDGDTLHVETLSVAEHGAVQIVDGGVAYTPETDYHGADRFTYVVSDGTGLTATASVDVTVLAVNDAPEPVEAIPDQELDEGGDTATVDLAGFFEDPDGDVLTYRATSSDTAVARVTVTAALLTVAPVQSGTATVTVSAEDRDGLTATQAFVVGVSDQLVQAVVGDTLAAMGRGHLASARMTLGRRARTAGSGRSRVTVLGGELPLGGAAARTSADRMPASWLPIPGTGSHSPSGGPSGMAAAGSRDGALLVGQGSLDVAWDEALRSSSFALGVQTGDNDTPGGGRTWTFWGQGDAQTFRGARDTRSGYAGQVITGYVGVDTQLTERWLVGVALARSSGDGDWRAGSSRGELGTTLTTVQPYARWSDGNTSVWTMAGGGRGNIENVRESTGSVEASGLGLAFGLVELRRRVGTVAGGLHLGLRGDLAWARLSTDAGGQTVDGVRAAVHQMRVGVELSRPFRMENGLVLTPFGELHARRDGGAGQTGAGLEVAAGLRARRGIVQVDAQGRMLAMHSADSYRERGASLTLSVGEGVRRPGLSLSLSPRWGAAASGTDALWQEQIHRRSAAAAAGDERALDARIDYGVRMPGGRLLTPFGAYGQSQFDRRLRFGAQLGTLEDSGNEPLRIELSVQRQMRPGNLTFHQFDILGVVNLRR